MYVPIHTGNTYNSCKYTYITILPRAKHIKHIRYEGYVEPIHRRLKFNRSFFEIEYRIF